MLCASLPPLDHEDRDMPNISMDLAHRIWTAHREIDVATKLLGDIEESLSRGEPPTPLDAFGRRRGYQLGVPSGDDRHRLFDVQPTLAREVIRAHIAAKMAELGAACQEAKTVLATHD